jgi:hypothetical protein
MSGSASGAMSGGPMMQGPMMQTRQGNGYQPNPYLMAQLSRYGMDPYSAIGGGAQMPQLLKFTGANTPTSVAQNLPNNNQWSFNPKNRLMGQQVTANPLYSNVSEPSSGG